MIYVGQTIRTLKERVAAHFLVSKNKYPAERVFHKYGIESFEISIIDYAETKEELNEKEKYWILALNCKVPFGYNIFDGGSSQSGYRHTEDTKQKLRELNAGKTLSDETKRKISKSMRGVKKSEEFRQKCIGRIFSKGTCLKISCALTGKKQSDEHRMKNSKSHTGLKWSEETRQKRSGKKHTEETRKKMSESQKERHRITKLKKEVL